MLEDLFKVVRDRFNDEKTPAATTHNHSRQHKNSDAKGDTPINRSGLDIPADLLFKCPRCHAVTYTEEFMDSWKVCVSCGYHARLTWRERLNITADDGTFTEYDTNMTSQNPISFPGYELKTASLKKEIGLNDAIVTGECLIRGCPAIVGVMDTRFMMASMGSVVGEKITRAFERAASKKMPVILFCASGGARMQEGIISLMQMVKTSGAIARLAESGQLYVSVLTDPTTGGVTASFASLGDIIIAEPKALIGFAGRRVIQDTIKQQLPDDFQSAEFQQQCGFVDMIVTRRRIRAVLAKILRIHNYKRVV